MRPISIDAENPSVPPLQLSDWSSRIRGVWPFVLPQRQPVYGNDSGANLPRRRSSDGFVSQKPSRRNPRGFRVCRLCFRGFVARVALGVAANGADQRVPAPTLLRRRGQALGLLSVLRGERNRERSTAPAKRSPAAGPLSGARFSEENEGFTHAAVNEVADAAGAYFVATRSRYPRSTVSGDASVARSRSAARPTGAPARASMRRSASVKRRRRS
jgi:hypothetical protein